MLIPSRLFRSITLGPKSNTLLIVGLILSTLITLAAMLSTSANAANGRMVQLYVDDNSRTLITGASTVGDVLREAGVEITPIDLVEPDISTPVGDGEFHINVYRAHPVMVVDGEKRFTISTPYSSPHLIAKSAGLTVYPEDHFDIELVDDFVREGFIGQKLTITRAVPVSVELDGQVIDLRTLEPNVRELLADKGIVLVGEDFTTISPDTPVTPNLHFAVVRVGHEVITEEEAIAYETRTIVDFDVPFGVSQVRQAGQPGRVVSSYEVRRHNGQEVSRELIGRTHVSDPVPAIVVKGRKILRSYSSNEQILSALRECETHGNYQANTGNGFYGAYQFARRTWDHWNTGYEYAHLAPPEIQDSTVLKNARASSGGFHSQHPGCSEYLGLPKFPF